MSMSALLSPSSYYSCTLIPSAVTYNIVNSWSFINLATWCLLRDRSGHLRNYISARPIALYHNYTYRQRRQYCIQAFCYGVVYVYDSKGKQFTFPSFHAPMTMWRGRDRLSSDHPRHRHRCHVPPMSVRARVVSPPHSHSDASGHRAVTQDLPSLFIRRKCLMHGTIL